MHLHSIIALTFSPSWPLQWIDARITDHRGASTVTWSCSLPDISRLGKRGFRMFAELPSHHGLIKTQPVGRYYVSL